MKFANILPAITAATIILSGALKASAEDHKLTFMLTGASFAVSENGWFEIGCDDMDAVAINKSVSGSAIYHCARDMYQDKFYTTAELDETDVFVIGHVHNQNVADPTWLKDDYTEYEASIATSTNYAIAYDYVIKRYIADCKALKDNPESKYYGTAEGKPVKIMFCTHWHDARTTYNPAIRKLAEKWGFPLIEFDTNIGFSKSDVESGEAQPSLAFAHDTETIYGVKFGWHPLRGTNSYIQQRMAQIFVAKAAEYLGLDIPFEANVSAVTPLVLPGEDAIAQVRFRAGTYPFQLESSTEVKSAHKRTSESSSITESPYFVNLGTISAENTFSVASCRDAEGSAAKINGMAEIKPATGSIAPSYDAYIHEAYKENNYTNTETLQLKNGSNWGRDIFLTFPTDNLKGKELDRIIVRLNFESYVLATRSDDKRDINSIETLQIAGNAHTYGNTLKWNNANIYAFTPITTTTIVPNQKDSYICFDVTDWVKEQLSDDAKQVSFRISVAKTSGMLSNFTASESTTHPDKAPSLLFAVKNESSSLASVGTQSLDVVSNTVNNPKMETLTIFDTLGNAYYHGNSPTVDLNNLAAGLYIVNAPSCSLKFLKR